MSFEVIRSTLHKHTLRKAKTQDLIRLAKWLKIDVENMDHFAVADQIYWKVFLGY